MNSSLSIWIGFDAREAAAFAVTRNSIERRLTQPIRTHGIVLSHLQEAGLYRRPTERRLGKLIDTLSARDDYDGQMSTEFAISRFFVPHLVKRPGWAAVMDCDMLARANLCRLFEMVEKTNYAVMCVKHDHAPSNTTKMDGQIQTRYARKNWSSMMLFNTDHPSNRALTLDMLNSVPGRDLHAFCWLKDEEIGELGPEWNYLVGHTNAAVDPKIVHFTDGCPMFQGFENVPYADEWRRELNGWAA